MKKLIKNVIAKFGYQIQKKQTNNLKMYDYGAEALEKIRIVKDYTMLPPENLITLYEQAVYCEKNGIKGSFVECGVWKGGAVGIMALANLKYSKERREMHLFDAFDDICAPNIEKDGKKAITEAQRYGRTEIYFNEKEIKPLKGFYNTFGGHGTIDSCRELLETKIEYNNKFIHYHKGWFQQTIPEQKSQINDIAILRLDGDWYDSIKICLENLYDKVVSGGIIIIDDYGYYEGCTKAVNEFLYNNHINTFLSYSSIGCRYFIKHSNV